MRRLGVALAFLVALLVAPASAQIVTYAAPLPVVAGGTESTIGGLVAGSAATIGFVSTTAGGGSCETCLVRDAANTLALKRAGVNSIFRVYSGTATIELGNTGGDPFITTSGAMRIGTTTGDVLRFYTGGSERWQMTNTGSLNPNVDNAQDIGTVGGVVRSGYFGTSLVIGSAPASALTGALFFTGITNANLGTPTNGHIVFCSDCTIANPCAGSGTGALAKRLNGVWVCN